MERAENGLAAVEKSREATFDIILLDLDMPIMSGYEACKKIKGGDKGIKDILQLDRKAENAGVES